MADSKELAATKAEDKQTEAANDAEAARHAKAVKATTVDKAKVKAAVEVVLSDGINQHKYVYQMVGSVHQAIDDPDAFLKPSGDGREEVVAATEDKAKAAAEEPKAKPEKKAKETKAERTARLKAEKEAKKKPKKGDAAGDPTKLAPGEAWDATAGATAEAKKQGVDMAGVEGTGAGGTVTKADVTAAAENK
jgi:hypothetical protein